MKKLLVVFILATLQIFAGIGNIMALKGSADVHRADNIMKAVTGMELLNGDKITTQAKTRTQILLKDDTIITIGAKSSFEFSDYFFDGTKNSKVKMKVNRGFFRSVTGKIGKLAPKRFTVETSSATIGIRGTDFSVNLQNAIERFRCYSGGIRITFGDTVKELRAGESFELNIHTLKTLTNNLGKGFKADELGRAELQGMDTPNLNGLEEPVRTVDRPLPPKPPTPSGVPCRHP